MMLPQEVLIDPSELGLRAGRHTISRAVLRVLPLTTLGLNIQRLIIFNLILSNMVYLFFAWFRNC
jgi:hypothetical protein